MVHERVAYSIAYTAQVAYCPMTTVSTVHPLDTVLTVTTRIEAHVACMPVLYTRGVLY